MFFVYGTWQDCEDQSYDERKKHTLFSNWSPARTADHVVDVQQARRVRGDPTCLVPVVFVSHDGQREVLR